MLPAAWKPEVALIDRGWCGRSWEVLERQTDKTSSFHRVYLKSRRSKQLFLGARLSLQLSLPETCPPQPLLNLEDAKLGPRRSEAVEEEALLQPQRDPRGSWPDLKAAHTFG